VMAATSPIARPENIVRVQGCVIAACSPPRRSGSPAEEQCACR
jgi:hypothetical protein